MTSSRLTLSWWMWHSKNNSKNVSQVHKYFWLLDKFFCRIDKSGRMIRVLAIHIVSIIWLTLICGKDKNKTFKFKIKVICIVKGKRIGAIQKTFCTLTNQMQSFSVILVYFKYFSDNPGSPFRLIDTPFKLNWGHLIYKYRNSYGWDGYWHT